MNPTIIGAMISGIIAILIVTINNCWTTLRDRKKDWGQLKEDANKTQIEFANTLRAELRKENIELNGKIDKLEVLVSNLTSEKNSLEVNYLNLMEQHSELRIQYASTIAESAECLKKYHEIQKKYEELLIQVSELKGVVDERGRVLSEIQI